MTVSEGLRCLRPWIRCEPPVVYPHYRPPGLWVYPESPTPTLFLLPHPLHPLEAIAALNGWDGDILTLARQRAVTWLEGTKWLSKFLGESVGDTRFLYYALTPLNAEADGRDIGLRFMGTSLYYEAGFGPREWQTAYDARLVGPARPNFWEEARDEGV